MKKFEYSKSTFFNKYGHRLVRVMHDNPETGDFMLYSPEENHIAQEYKNSGHVIGSVYEHPYADGIEDTIVLDNNTSSGFHKIGFVVLLPDNL